MPEHAEEIELRSEEVNEILSKPPNWVIRYGITVILISILAIIVASWFIKYPDVIKAKVSITSLAPPAKIIAREDGELNILVSDNEHVGSQQYLGMIHNEAIVEDIIALKKICQSFNTKNVHNISLAESYNVGIVQSDFYEFERVLNQYRSFLDLKYNERQIASIKKRILHLKDLRSSSVRELRIATDEKELAQENFSMDSILYEEKASSKLKRNQSKSTYLSITRSYEQLGSAIVNIDLQIEELTGRIQDIEITRERENRELIVQLENGVAALKYAIQAWEQRFVLISPFEGSVILNKFWSNHQYTKRGDEVFTVLPLDNSPVGRTELPIQGSGKVEIGQRVIIKLDNFPYREYGTLRGTVDSKSTIPVNNTYALIIGLPEGMTSSYKKDLGYEQELNGTAEIITKELRLLERVFNQFRSLMDEST